MTLQELSAEDLKQRLLLKRAGRHEQQLGERARRKQAIACLLQSLDWYHQRLRIFTERLGSRYQGRARRVTMLLLRELTQNNPRMRDNGGGTLSIFRDPEKEPEIIEFWIALGTKTLQSPLR